VRSNCQSKTVIQYSGVTRLQDRTHQCDIILYNIECYVIIAPQNGLLNPLGTATVIDNVAVFLFAICSGNKGF